MEYDKEELQLSKARSESEKKKMVTLTDDIGNRDRAFVLFYATWCPYSQRFLPVFEEYSKDNPKECLSLAIDDKPEVCEEYSIEYYPTVILFKRGKVFERLAAKPGIGLDRKQLRDFAESE